MLGKIERRAAATSERSQRCIPPFITGLTGITDTLVADAPAFAEVYALVEPHLRARRALIYNADFDVPMLRRNIARSCGLPQQPIAAECLMKAYARFRGERHPPGQPRAGQLNWQKLEVACRQMGVELVQEHQTLGDCRAALALLTAMSAPINAGHGY